MVELIITMMIVGILAVSVVPRLENLSAFDAIGFHDQTVATLRFAQKTALAQRRAVCVTTSDTGVSLKIAAAATDNDACAAGAVFTPPFSPRTSTGLQSATFNFLRLGETDQAADTTLTVTNANTITIDRVTGYVR